MADVKTSWTKYTYSFGLYVIVQTRVSVLPLISKYRQAGWKYETKPTFFNQLVCIEKSEGEHFRVLNLLLKLIYILGENRDYS